MTSTDPVLNKNNKRPLSEKRASGDVAPPEQRISLRVRRVLGGDADACADAIAAALLSAKRNPRTGRREFLNPLSAFSAAARVLLTKASAPPDVLAKLDDLQSFLRENCHTDTPLYSSRCNAPSDVAGVYEQLLAECKQATAENPDAPDTLFEQTAIISCRYQGPEDGGLPIGMLVACLPTGRCELGEVRAYVTQTGVRFVVVFGDSTRGGGSTHVWFWQRLSFLTRFAGAPLSILMYPWVKSKDITKAARKSLGKLVRWEKFIKETCGDPTAAGASDAEMPFQMDVCSDVTDVTIRKALSGVAAEQPHDVDSGETDATSIPMVATAGRRWLQTYLPRVEMFGGGAGGSGSGSADNNDDRSWVTVVQELAFLLNGEFLPLSVPPTHENVDVLCRHFGFSPEHFCAVPVGLVFSPGPFVRVTDGAVQKHVLFRPPNFRQLFEGSVKALDKKRAEERQRLRHAVRGLLRMFVKRGIAPIAKSVDPAVGKAFGVLGVSAGANPSKGPTAAFLEHALLLKCLPMIAFVNQLRNVIKPQTHFSHTFHTPYYHFVVEFIRSAVERAIAKRAVRKVISEIDAHFIASACA